MAEGCGGTSVTDQNLIKPSAGSSLGGRTGGRPHINQTSPRGLGRSRVIQKFIGNLRPNWKQPR